MSLCSRPYGVISVIIFFKQERTLAMREKALKVKESVLETRDRNSHLNDDQSIVDLQNKLLRSEQEKVQSIIHTLLSFLIVPVHRWK